jgi:UPF0271 protein
MPPKIYVLDTMAFLTQSGFSMKDELYTVSGVENELRRVSDKDQFGLLINAGLTVREPDQKYINKITETARSTGDDKRLSFVDISLLALALELKAILVTDDYSQQNVASELGIPFQGVEEKGITQVWTWELRCKGCGRRFEEKYESCPVCGSELKTVRKQSKKRIR